MKHPILITFLACLSGFVVGTILVNIQQTQDINILYQEINGLNDIDKGLRKRIQSLEDPQYNRVQSIEQELKCWEYYSDKCAVIYGNCQDYFETPEDYNRCLITQYTIWS